VVGGTFTTFMNLVDVEFMGETIEAVPAFYVEDGDLLIGRGVLNEFVTTFDGPQQELRIEK